MNSPGPINNGQQSYNYWTPTLETSTAAECAPPDQKSLPAAPASSETPVEYQLPYPPETPISRIPELRPLIPVIQANYAEYYGSSPEKAREKLSAVPNWKLGDYRKLLDFIKTHPQDHKLQTIFSWLLPSTRAVFSPGSLDSAEMRQISLGDGYYTASPLISVSNTTVSSNGSFIDFIEGKLTGGKTANSPAWENLPGGQELKKQFISAFQQAYGDKWESKWKEKELETLTIGKLYELYKKYAKMDPKTNSGFICHSLLPSIRTALLRASGLDLRPAGQKSATVDSELINFERFLVEVIIPETADMEGAPSSDFLGEKEVADYVMLWGKKERLALADKYQARVNILRGFDGFNNSQAALRTAIPIALREDGGGLEPWEIDELYALYLSSDPAVREWVTLMEDTLFAGTENSPYGKAGVQTEARSRVLNLLLENPDLPPQEKDKIKALRTLLKELPDQTVLEASIKENERTYQEISKQFGENSINIEEVYDQDGWDQYFKSDPKKDPNGEKLQKQFDSYRKIVADHRSLPKRLEAVQNAKADLKELEDNLLAFSPDGEAELKKQELGVMLEQSDLFLAYSSSDFSLETKELGKYYLGKEPKTISDFIGLTNQLGSPAAGNEEKDLLLTNFLAKQKGNIIIIKEAKAESKEAPTLVFAGKTFLAAPTTDVYYVQKKSDGSLSYQPVDPSKGCSSADRTLAVLLAWGSPDGYLADSQAALILNRAYGGTIDDQTLGWVFYQQKRTRRSHDAFLKSQINWKDAKAESVGKSGKDTKAADDQEIKPLLDTIAAETDPAKRREKVLAELGKLDSKSLTAKFDKIKEFLDKEKDNANLRLLFGLLNEELFLRLKKSKDEELEKRLDGDSIPAKDYTALVTGTIDELGGLDDPSWQKRLENQAYKALQLLTVKQPPEWKKEAKTKVKEWSDTEQNIPLFMAAARKIRIFLELNLLDIKDQDYNFILQSPVLTKARSFPKPPPQKTAK